MINIEIAKSINCNGEYSAFITSDYNQKLVDTIRTISNRHWEKNSKCWEIGFSSLHIVIEAMNNCDININCADYSIFDKPNLSDVEKIDFEFKTKPFNHQIEGFNYGMTHTNWLLGDEQGLGKTKQVIDIAVAKKKMFGYKHCLIICGVNGLKWNWQNEIRIHSNETGYIIGQREKKSRTVIGSTNDKIYDLTHLESISSYFLITNVETLRNTEIVALLSKYCTSREIGMIAMDECHKCKNSSSQQGKGLLKLKADNMIAMSGTPLMNTPLDLYVPLKWLGYEKHSFYQFKNHYCKFGGYGGYQIVGYQHLEELYSATKDIMLRRLKEDALDLPDKTYVDEYVEMTPKQEQIYKEVTASIKANIDQIKIANNPLAELIRMRQATGYTGILSSTIEESAKIDRLVEIVDDAVENGKKVVIFSNWTQMTLPIYDALATHHVGTYITGEVDSEQRQQHVEKFQNDENCKFVVGTIGAMGTGLTLTAGTIVVFMDEPWNMANKQQAIDRCHRIGTKENILVYTIMCKNTIDERIHDIVESKGKMSDVLIDGKIVGDKLELLNYLLS